MQTKNTIFLRRRNRIIIPLEKQSGATLSNELIVALLRNVESLGFTLSDELIEEVKKLPHESIKDFYNELITTLKDLVGAHVKYKPLYPNFPKQVADADEIELYMNARLHYFGDVIGVRILPAYEEEARPDLDEAIQLTIINRGTTEQFEEIFTSLIESKVSMSATDAQDVGWFIKTYGDDVERLMPKDIPNRENLAIAACELVRYSPATIEFIRAQFKTATDVLRLITALSGGDVSLAQPTKYRQFTRPQRRALLSLLEGVSSIIEDMLRYKEYWKRCGERLHPGDYSAKYTKAYKAFATLRGDIPVKTFNSEVEAMILSGDIAAAVTKLATRPGELARRLDQLVRTKKETESVINAFSAVAKRVSSTVLLQLLAHFSSRNKQPDIRVFFPKGNVAKLQAISNTLPKLDELTRQQIVEICKDTLKEKYSHLSPLGNVYIDRQLKHYTIPFALRSASRSLKTVGRGTRLELPRNASTLRFFIWWKDGINRTDIDLSAVGLGSESQYISDIAYYNLKELGAYHSGDITSAPDGASEFIDVDIDKLMKRGIRYVVMCVNSYTQQPFYDLPECFTGFMSREMPHSGEIYEPKTVQNKIDLTAATKFCIPMIFDLESRQVIWVDLAVAHRPSLNNNVYNNMSSITVLNKALLSLQKPSLYDLFLLHAEARGKRVAKKAEANTIFDVKDGITPFDTETITSKFI